MKTDTQVHPQSTSLRTRLLYSVGSNSIRAAISFLIGLLVARALRPAAFGDLMFLLGSFVAIRPLLDMGASNAFFTFLSQRSRERRFYLYYFGWLALQFFAALLLVALIIPDNIFRRIWLGNDREIVVLALIASFLQQQVWQTVGQIGEAGRKTIKVQSLNLFVVLVYMVTVSMLTAFASVSIMEILLILIGQYAAATLLAFWILRGDSSPQVAERVSASIVLREYWEYCRPLIALSLVTVSFDFADKWLLQRFGGPVQQGFFQVANQFSAISLLATSSILNVFWKEIAAAWADGDRERVARLYKKVNRGLVMLGAILTGLLLPWAQEIVSILLGDAYLKAWPVLAIMLLYPIHQSMGQIGGTMLYASGHTKKYMAVSALVMMFSIPVSYLMLASPSNAIIPGFGLGAVGMAVKMVLVGVVSVNLQAWVIGRYCGWKLDWVFQAVGITLMIALGFLAKHVAGLVWDVSGNTLAQLVGPVMLDACIYIGLVIAAILRLPWLLGLDSHEIHGMLDKASLFLRKRKTV
jgi:O-antigen/teichoic acid export membrane protein